MKKIKYWTLIFIYLFLVLADGFLTFINTPDLSMEGNPLVKYFNLGWGALALANVIVFALLFMASYYSYFKYKTVFTNETKFTSYCSQIIYDRPDMFWKGIIPKHITPIIAALGFSSLYTYIIARAILVFEWIYITFNDHWWMSKYFVFTDKYCFGRLYIFVGTISCFACLFYWLYKEFKKQLAN